MGAGRDLGGEPRWGLLAGTLQLARATPDRTESDAILEAGIGAALRLAGNDV